MVWYAVVVAFLLLHAEPCHGRSAPWHARIHTVTHTGVYHACIKTDRLASSQPARQTDGQIDRFIGAKEFAGGVC